LLTVGHKGAQNKEPFPVVQSKSIKRSYGPNYTTSWAKDKFVSQDITKILRNARKLPEKTKPFYNELNKVRRAALAYGFIDLIEGIAACLDFEQKNLNESKPAAAKSVTSLAEFKIIFFTRLD